MANKREHTTAINKKRIVEALLKLLAEEDFQEIKIATLCKEAKVSQASFYNYFPQKRDVIVHFIQLWTLETTWYAQRDAEQKAGLSIIESIYKRAAHSIREHPQIMAEVIAVQARMQMPQEWPLLTEADKTVSFPTLEGIEQIEASGLDGILAPNLEAAIRNGELPTSTPVMSVVIALSSLFFGIPLLLHAIPTDRLEDIFQQQLDLIWAGARNI